MEVKPGTIPLVTLAFIFAGLQVWWISLTLRNNKSVLKTKENISENNHSKKDSLKKQRDRLEKLLKK